MSPKGAVRQNDTTSGLDEHTVTSGTTTVKNAPHPAAGTVATGESSVLVNGQAIATEKSEIKVNPHTPMMGSFQSPPSHEGTVDSSSTSVKAGGAGVVRKKDPVTTCTEGKGGNSKFFAASVDVLVGD